MSRKYTAVWGRIAEHLLTWCCLCRLTSHTAGGAAETQIGFERLAMENVQQVLTGQEPLTPVNKHLIKN